MLTLTQLSPGDSSIAVPQSQTLSLQVFSEFWGKKCSQGRQGLGKRLFILPLSFWIERNTFLGDLFLKSTIFMKAHTIFSKLFSFFSLKIYSNHLKGLFSTTTAKNTATHMKFASTPREK